MFDVGEHRFNRDIPLPNPSPEGEGLSFAMTARRLSGQAAVLFGWTPDVFWAATPDELAAVIEAARGAVVAPPDLGALMERFPDDGV